MSERRVLPGKTTTGIGPKPARKVKRARVHRSGLACGDIMEFSPLFGDDPRMCSACYKQAQGGFELGGHTICYGCAQDFVSAVVRDEGEE